MTTNQQQRVQELKQCGLSTREAEAQARQEQQHTPGPWDVSDPYGKPRLLFNGDEKPIGPNLSHLVLCGNQVERHGWPESIKEQRDELGKALLGLADLCDHVPIFQLDDGKASVQAVRRAGKFVKALETARAALTKAGIQP